MGNPCSVANAFSKYVLGKVMIYSIRIKSLFFAKNIIKQ
jgi:hypothetical protein